MPLSPDVIATRRSWPLEGEAGRPIKGELWVCPLCFDSVKDAAPNPMEAILCEGHNILARVLNASRFVHASASDAKQHMISFHGLDAYKVLVGNDIIQRHKIRDADGLVHRFLHASGKRHILDINEYWGWPVCGAPDHNMRDCFNTLHAIAKGGGGVPPPASLADPAGSRALWDEMLGVWGDDPTDEDRRFVVDQPPQAFGPMPCCGGASGVARGGARGGRDAPGARRGARRGRGPRGVRYYLRVRGAVRVAFVASFILSYLRSLTPNAAIGAFVYTHRGRQDVTVAEIHVWVAWRTQSLSVH